ncbi:hypothetical protein NC99_33480 [Sunxiuqinia dokdonensis]|uniref:Uncharacterized protein n=1 Tax=Sunxiuqinia dokdonensis TaxID=1409788 RepID=A0A0L8V6M9_9BACT|nr:hypothetical protein NC99_33480 [Sunxiuqinia dokdonensis]
MFLNFYAVADTGNCNKQNLVWAVIFERFHNIKALLFFLIVKICSKKIVVAYDCWHKYC